MLESQTMKEGKLKHETMLQRFANLSMDEAKTACGGQ